MEWVWDAQRLLKEREDVRLSGIFTDTVAIGMIEATDYDKIDKIDQLYGHQMIIFAETLKIGS